MHFFKKAIVANTQVQKLLCMMLLLHMEICAPRCLGLRCTEWKVWYMGRSF